MGKLAMFILGYIVGQTVALIALLLGWHSIDE